MGNMVRPSGKQDAQAFVAVESRRQWAESDLAARSRLPSFSLANAAPASPGASAPGAKSRRAGIR